MAELDILRAIQDKGLRVKWVAGQVGIEETSLHRKLRGQRPPITRAQAVTLSHVTGIPLTLIPHLPEPKDEVPA